MKTTAELNENDSSFMGTKDASKLWGVAQNTISRWCREKRIDGVEQDADGSPWRIPRNARPPKRK